MTRPQPGASQAVTSKFAALLDDSRFSDLTLRCEGEEFHVHKCIVCLHSPVFAAACGGNFQEAKDNSIEVSVANRATLAQMLKYFYTEDYDDNPAPFSTCRTEPDISSESSNTSIDSDVSGHAGPSNRASKATSNQTETSNGLTAHVQIYIAADYYQIPGLLDLALMKLQAASRKTSVNKIAEVVGLIYDFKSDPAAERLRSMFCSIIVNYADPLLLQPYFLDESVHLPEFMRDLLPQLCSRLK